MFAVVDIAGTQELVKQGEKLKVPLHADAKEGDNVTFDSVLLVSDGDALTIGTPVISGATVVAKVVGHGRGDKIRIQKLHRRKRYRRVKGHRQHFTEIEV